MRDEHEHAHNRSIFTLDKKIHVIFPLFSTKALTRVVPSTMCF